MLRCLIHFYSTSKGFVSSIQVVMDSKFRRKRARTETVTKSESILCSKLLKLHARDERWKEKVHKKTKCNFLKCNLVKRETNANYCLPLSLSLPAIRISEMKNPFNLFFVFFLKTQMVHHYFFMHKGICTIFLLFFSVQIAQRRTPLSRKYCILH